MSLFEISTYAGCLVEIYLHKGEYYKGEVEKLDANNLEITIKVRFSSHEPLLDDELKTFYVGDIKSIEKVLI